MLKNENGKNLELSYVGVGEWDLAFIRKPTLVYLKFILDIMAKHTWITCNVSLFVQQRTLRKNESAK